MLVMMMMTMTMMMRNLMGQKTSDSSYGQGFSSLATQQASASLEEILSLICPVALVSPLLNENTIWYINLPERNKKESNVSSVAASKDNPPLCHAEIIMITHQDSKDTNSQLMSQPR